MHCVACGDQDSEHGAVKLQLDVWEETTIRMKCLGVVQEVLGDRQFAITANK
jgi:hypothetical protein